MPLSTATKRNWERLGIDSLEGKLESRANKSRSRKFITPTEYFDNRSNLPTIERMADQLRDSARSIPDIMYSLGVSLLRRHGLVDVRGRSSNQSVENFLKECSADYTLVDEAIHLTLPRDESDALGLIYQCLLSEGAKNILGSYYTPRAIVQDMVAGIALSENEKVLDPCCGSLVCLLNIPGIQPYHIYAIDLDGIAVMLAKFNYFLRFPGASSPNIFQANFLEGRGPLNDHKFDFVVTNPPWGAEVNLSGSSESISSGESFSEFLLASHEVLRRDGQLRFLLPESVMNVRAHREVRKFILSRANLTSIRTYSKLFSGVTTKYVAMTVTKSGNDRDVMIHNGAQIWKIPKTSYEASPNFVFRMAETEDERIIHKAMERKEYDLSSSVWALGIVTGDNKKHLHQARGEGMEPIYTGKEIEPFKLGEAKWFVAHDRTQYQQAAKEEIYRSTSKLAYRFISRKLTFAVDTSGSLFLNSANIVIPNIPGCSTKSVAALLNSELYQFLYIKLFGEIKILKGNLLQLPFPQIEEHTDSRLGGFVDEVISGDWSSMASIHDLVYGIFDMTSTEAERVRRELYGAAT